MSICRYIHSPKSASLTRQRTTVFKILLVINALLLQTSVLAQSVSQTVWIPISQWTPISEVSGHPFQKAIKRKL